mmetsp:Transcript_5135/g.8458  ORF Transcript_5135/g.8458 Transcript_5135/m.8458 type:complete len:225 (-) Transcript_5135:5-679(-)
MPQQVLPLVLLLTILLRLLLTIPLRLLLKRPLTILPRPQRRLPLMCRPLPRRRSRHMPQLKRPRTIPRRRPLATRRWRPLLTPLRLLALRLWRPRRPLPPRCRHTPLQRPQHVLRLKRPLITQPRSLLATRHLLLRRTLLSSLVLRLWRPQRPLQPRLLLKHLARRRLLHQLVPRLSRRLGRRLVLPQQPRLLRRNTRFLSVKTAAQFLELTLDLAYTEAPLAI